MDDIIEDFKKLTSEIEDTAKRHPEDEFLKDVLECIKGGK